MTDTQAGILLATAVFLIVAGLFSVASGIQEEPEKNYCDIELLINVQLTAYEKGYTDGLEENDEVVTIYLCRDWIPLKGYKAWRQCNMDYVAQTERENKGE